MSADISRLAALRKGITHSRDEGYVAIRVADLRWLLDQAESTAVSPAVPASPANPEGDHHEPDHD
jgi:hypothetical protein